MNPFFSTVQSGPESDSFLQDESLLPIDKALEKSLVTILKQEQLCLEQLILILKTENEAIIKRETTVMGSLLDKKLPLLSKLEQLDSQRQELFVPQKGLTNCHQAFSHFIEQHPSKTIQMLWDIIKKYLSKCKKLNELNGRMINIRQNNTDQILQILMGRPINDTQTYSHSGQTNQQKRNVLYTNV